jgi:hypothetical protein
LGVVLGIPCIFLVFRTNHCYIWILMIFNLPHPAREPLMWLSLRLIPHHLAASKLLLGDPCICTHSLFPQCSVDPQSVLGQLLNQDCGEYLVQNGCCRVLRHMPIGDIDPSLALGFLCRSSEELVCLCLSIKKLELTSGGAPVVSFQERRLDKGDRFEQLGLVRCANRVHVGEQAEKSWIDAKDDHTQEDEVDEWTVL